MRGAGLTRFKVGSAFIWELQSHVAVNADDGRAVDDEAEAGLAERPDGGAASLGGREGPESGDGGPAG